MKIEVPNGEILDKLTILEIKQAKITDEDKLKNINNEITLIHKFIDNTSLDYGTHNDLWDLFVKLKDINMLLWDVEDALRSREQYKMFDSHFTEFARMVYKLNDQRSNIKRKINEITNSDLIEEKSYKEYNGSN